MPWTKIAAEESANSLSLGAGEGGRCLTYRTAIREALYQALKRDPDVFVFGEGVDDSAGVFGSTLDLHKEFGDRVFDTPIAENALTGIAVGAALCRMRPVLIHMRMDFLLLSLDQILNHAAKFRYMSGGKVRVPLVIRAIIGRGWGSAGQHSQSLHALFMHTPGIKVVMPSSAYDAKGLLLSGIADNNPVIFIEHRWLYDIEGSVPEQEYLIPLGRGSIRKEGKDVTVAAVSLMVYETVKAMELLKDSGIGVELVDPRCLSPLDGKIIADSVKKTGRLVIADLGWKSAGLAEIILGRIHNEIRGYLKSDVRIVSLPDTPAPAGYSLEKAFYPGAEEIAEAVKKTL